MTAVSGENPQMHRESKLLGERPETFLLQRSSATNGAIPWLSHKFMRLATFLKSQVQYHKPHSGLITL